MCICLFFLIAGYLFGYKRVRGYADQRQFLVDKAKRTLVPYLTVSMLLVALQQAKIGQIIAGSASHLWFLITIFKCYAVGKLIDFVLWERMRTRVVAFLVAGVCFVLAYFYSFVLGGSFPQHFFYYLGGMLLASADLNGLCKWRTPLVLLALAALAAMAIMVAWRSCGLLLRPIGVVLVFSSFLVFRTLRINGVPLWIKSLDVCSMGIYIVHHIIIQATNRTSLLHPLLHSYYYIYPTVQFFLVLLFSWGLVWALRRYAWARYFGL